MTGAPEDRGFLSRWAQRKEAAKRGEPDAEVAPAAPEPGLPEAEVAPEAPETRSEAEVLAALGLPDPDTLTAGADFKAFMAAGVPTLLRNRALRALWRSDPRLANLDGLVDHGDDFSDKATVGPDLKTAYRVGRGIVRQLAESAGEARPEPVAEPADRAGSREAAEAPVDAPVEADDVAEAPLVPTPEAPEADEAPAARRPRRMRFSADAAAILAADASEQRE